MRSKNLYKTSEFENVYNTDRLVSDLNIVSNYMYEIVCYGDDEFEIKIRYVRAMQFSILNEITNI